MAESNGNDSKLEYKQRIYDQYLTERESLLKTKKETVTQLDKALLTLNAGALAISITFIREIAPHPENWTMLLLIVSWMSFVASLVFTLLSFRKSAEAFDRQIEIIEEDLKRELDEEPDENSADEADIEEKEPLNAPRKHVRMLNLCSLWTFIAGVGILCIFAAANLYKTGDKMTEKNIIVRVVPEMPVKTGVDPPKAPVKPPKPPAEPARPKKK